MCSAGYLLTDTPSEVSKGRRAKTKLQQRCLDLADTLPGLTDAQVRWARKRMQPLGYVVSRGRGGKHSCVWCQECGQMDEPDGGPLVMALMPTHTCSRCGRRLDVKQWHGSAKECLQRFQFVVVTVADGMQVARAFVWEQRNKMGRATKDSITEVFQIWFEPTKQKEVILSKPYYRSIYSFHWNDGAWKVKKHNAHATGYYAFDDVYDLRGHRIYPRAKVLPVLRRFGYHTGLLQMETSPIDVWRGLLNDEALEGIIKAGQWRVADWWFAVGGPRRDKSLWLPMVRICNRHKYFIEDVSMWMDCVQMLHDLGMDAHNPKYICPDDLQKMHDWLLEKRERQRVREELQKLRSKAKNWEQYYQEKKGAFFPVKFNDGNIFCHVITSVAEMCEEGTRLHHCVYKMDYYKKADALILSARDRGGNRLETVEVNLKTFRVVQSRGLQNQTTGAHGDIIALVEKNMYQIKQADLR